jgi:hypothetical protein
MAIYSGFTVYPLKMVSFHSYVGLPKGNIGKNENKQLEVLKPWRFPKPAMGGTPSR